MVDYLEKELGAKELLIGGWSYLWKRPRLTGMVFLVYFVTIVVGFTIAALFNVVRSPLVYVLEAIVLGLYSAYITPLVLKAISFLVDEEASFSLKCCISWANKFFVKIILYFVCVAGVIFLVYLVSVVFFIILSFLSFIPLIGRILFGIGYFLWMLLFAVVGIRLGLSIYALLFDEQKIIDSLKIAWLVTRGKGKRIFALLLAFLLVGVVANLPTMLTVRSNSNVYILLGSSISLVLGLLVSIYLFIVLYRLYFNLKKFNFPVSEK